MNNILPEEIITNPGINLGNPAFRPLIEGAKRDEPIATFLLLTKILTPQRIENIKAQIGDTGDVVFIPISPQRGGKNFLPLGVAEFLQYHIGGQIHDALGLVASEGKRQTQKFWERLITPRTFDILENCIPLLQGKRIFVVDDQFTTGGTVRDAIKSLNRKNLLVENVITLGTSYCRKLKASCDLIQKFQQQFGKESESQIAKITGYQICDLTFSELYTILKLKGNSNELEKKSQKRSPNYSIRQTIEEAMEFKRKLMEEHKPQREAFHNLLKTLPKFNSH